MLALGLDQGTRYPEDRNRTGTFLQYRNRTGTSLPRTGTGPEPALRPEGTRNTKRGPILLKIWLLLEKKPIFNFSKYPLEILLRFSCS